jgi:hypothetical protein
MKLRKLGGSDLNSTPIGLERRQWAVATGNLPRRAECFRMRSLGQERRCPSTEAAQSLQETLRIERRTARPRKRTASN